VIYEMLTALPPFYSKKREELFSMIQTKEPLFPSYLSECSIDLIKNLLLKDPALRLTSAQDIKSHPFFRAIDWKLMLKKRLRTPYKP
jgi:serine/threonine protein kinase